MVSYNKRHVVFAVSIIVTMLTLVHLGFVVGIFPIVILEDVNTEHNSSYRIYPTEYPYQDSIIKPMENINFEVQFEQCPKQAVHWSIAEGARGGVITEGGAYTAPNTPGVYQIQVRSVETGLQASAFVSVRDLHET